MSIGEIFDYAADFSILFLLFNFKAAFIVMGFSSSEMKLTAKLSSQPSLPSANSITKIGHTYCLITNIICCRNFVDKFTFEKVYSITDNLLLLSPRSYSFLSFKISEIDMLLEVGAILEFNNYRENCLSYVQKLNLDLKFESQKLII